MSIKVFYDGIGFRQKGIRKLRTLIGKILEREECHPGNINIIITSDDSLIEINREFLEHDYYTDVITFQYNEGKEINGEVYISIESVRANALNYKVSLSTEMLRVIIHGILHMAGYDDKTKEEKARMREMENYWIGEFEN